MTISWPWAVPLWVLEFGIWLFRWALCLSCHPCLDPTITIGALTWVSGIGRVMYLIFCLLMECFRGTNKVHTSTSPCICPVGAWMILLGSLPFWGWTPLFVQEQGSANFAFKGTIGKYFRLFPPCLLCNHSSLQSWAGHNKQAWLCSNKA
jgi:hypothetical protein